MVPQIQQIVVEYKRELSKSKAIALTEVMFLAYGDLFTDLYVAFELGGTQSVMGRVTFAIIGVSWMFQGT